MASYDDLNNRQIFTVSIISVALTFITILACQVVYYAMAERAQEKKLQQGEYVEGNSLLADQSGSLSSYGVNPNTGQIQVPVDVVIAKMAEGQSENQNENTNTDNET